MRVLGLLIATGGGVAIGFGWAGAAQEGCVDCQIPYLLSGGAAGIGLIIFGIALLLLAQIRTESRRLGDRIEHALGLRVRAGEPKRPPPEREPTAAEPAAKEPESKPESREEAQTPAPLAETPAVRAAVIAGTAEPVPEDLARASAEPAPNPAVSVDAPGSESDAQSSDAATVAATTVAGGVVDTEGDDGGAAPTAEAAGEPTSPAGRPSEDVSGPPSAVEQAQDVLARRSASTKRRGLFFWRRQEP